MRRALVWVLLGFVGLGVAAYAGRGALLSAIGGFLIVQDEVSFVVFGVSVLVALTRIGPGLAALGASRNPEGMAAIFTWDRARRGSRTEPGTEPVGHARRPASAIVPPPRASTSRAE